MLRRVSKNPVNPKTHIFGYFFIEKEKRICVQIRTLKPRYNKPGYSEFHDIVNKTQLQF